MKNEFLVLTTRVQSAMKCAGKRIVETTFNQNEGGFVTSLL